MENGFVLQIDYKNENKILDILNSDLFNDCLKISYLVPLSTLIPFILETC